MTEVADNTGDKVTKKVYRVALSGGARYTLNVYTTTSRFLLNGKDRMMFLENDMPKIHSIVEYLCESNNIDLQTYNRLLADKLSQFLTKQYPDQSSSSLKAITERSSPGKESKLCPGCGKNCLTKSVLCTVGNPKHWVHYRCDRLAIEEIEKLESSEDSVHDYCCRFHSSIRVAKPHKPYQKKILSLPHIPVSPEQAPLRRDDQSEDEHTTQTIALDILAEQTDIEQTFIKSIVPEANTHNNETIILIDTPDGEVNIPTVSKSTKLNTDLPKKGSHSVSSVKPQPTCACSLKLSDLRDRENKLCKKEDDCKLLQLKHQEKLKETNKLEVYVQKLEAKNTELQHTLNTFVKRIETL